MSRRAVVTKRSRAELLSTCRQITRVLGDLETLARSLGMTSRHAALQARLVVFLCRLEAGHSSLKLLLEMNIFVHEYNAHLEVLSP